MDITTKLNEKIQRLQDLNKEMGKIGQQIGALQEQGKALYNAALEVKGAIDTLAGLKADEEARMNSSETAKLTLPEGVSPIIPEAAVGDKPATTLEIVK